MVYEEIPGADKLQSLIPLYASSLHAQLPFPFKKPRVSAGYGIQKEGAEVAIVGIPSRTGGNAWAQAEPTCSSAPCNAYTGRRECSLTISWQKRKGVAGPCSIHRRKSELRYRRIPISPGSSAASRFH